MKLSDRLQSVAGLVTMGSRLADIGTDHAYVPITLVAEQKIPSAIAMDIKKGPLQIAKEHIDRAGFGQYISVRLSDGLEKLRAGEADSIVIAGMGGRLAVKILSEGAAKLDGVREIILQPQSEIAYVRRYLREHGMRIEMEKMVMEDGKYYPMFRVILKEDEAGGFPECEEAVAGDLPECKEAAAVGLAECKEAAAVGLPEYTDIFDVFGRLLLERRDETLLSYLRYKKKQYEKVAAQLESVWSAEYRKQAIADEIALIEKAFAYMEV